MLNFNVTLEMFAKALNLTMESFNKINFTELPMDFKDWVEAHPGQAGFYIAQGVIFFVPGGIFGPIVGPILSWIGFGGAGPVGGTMAAAYQASVGNVVAGGIFATCQSAMMGGYGVVRILNLVRLGAMGAAGAGFAFFQSGDRTASAPAGKKSHE